MPVTNPFRAVLLMVALTVLSLAAAAGVAAAPARAQGCSGADKRGLPKAAANRAVFCLINQQRRARGLRPLRRNARLGRVARLHARDIVRYQFTTHTSPRRGSLATRVKRSGYGRNRSLAFGEILAAGQGRWSTPRAVVRGWMRRSIHRTAILYPRFRAMGVGISRGMPTGNRKRSGRSFVVTFAS